MTFTCVLIFYPRGSRHLADQVIDHIRGRQQEDFEKYIASARKHDLLNSPNGGLYQTLDELRRLRKQSSHSERG